MKLKYIETEVNLIDDIGRWQHYIGNQVRSENIKIRIPVESMKASYLQAIMNSVPCGIICVPEKFKNRTKQQSISLLLSS